MHRVRIRPHNTTKITSLQTQECEDVIVGGVDPIGLLVLFLCIGVGVFTE